MIGMMLWWILVIAAVVWFVQARDRARDAAVTPRSAEQILEERFARGEIDADELQARRTAIAQRT